MHLQMSGIESRAQSLLGKHSTIEIHPQTLLSYLNKTSKLFGANFGKRIVQVARAQFV